MTLSIVALSMRVRLATKIEHSAYWHLTQWHSELAMTIECHYAECHGVLLTDKANRSREFSWKPVVVEKVLPCIVTSRDLYISRVFFALSTALCTVTAQGSPSSVTCLGCLWQWNPNRIISLCHINHGGHGKYRVTAIAGGLKNDNVLKSSHFNCRWRCEPQSPTATCFCQSRSRSGDHWCTFQTNIAPGQELERAYKQRSGQRGNIE